MPMTTDSRHGYGIAPNLLDRNFTIDAPDTVWLADISYIPTDEGWLYLAAVKDLGTMEVVGWSMSERLKSTLCEDALKMAIRNRRAPKRLIHHSDRGVQYACREHQKLLYLHGTTASMSRKGHCLDNAPMESFFGALKTEMVHRTRFRTRREARAALFEYIEIFYNRQRRHSSIGYRPPPQAKMDMPINLAAKKTWSGITGQGQEHQRARPGHSMQFAQVFDCLWWKRNAMGPALHALCRNLSDGLAQIELVPMGLAELARPRGEERQQLQACALRWHAFEAVDGEEQAAEVFPVRQCGPGGDLRAD